MAMDVTKALLFLARVGFAKRRVEERQQQSAPRGGMPRISAERQAELQRAFDKLAAECIPNYQPQAPPADK